jgi:hypothetical protein
MISLTTNNGRGRAVKFTPERIDQIINLVERGTSREDIAATIGCTVGSLQVTCSRLGVSLRRARPRNGVVYKMSPPEDEPPPPSSDNGHTNGKPAHIEVPVPALVKPQQVELSLVLRSNGQERVFSIPLPQDVLVRLSLEACVNDKTLAEMIAEILKQK